MLICRKETHTYNLISFLIKSIYVIFFCTHAIIKLCTQFKHQLMEFKGFLIWNVYVDCIRTTMHQFTTEQLWIVYYLSQLLFLHQKWEIQSKCFSVVILRRWHSSNWRISVYALCNSLSCVHICYNVIVTKSCHLYFFFFLLFNRHSGCKIIFFSLVIDDGIMVLSATTCLCMCVWIDGKATRQQIDYITFYNKT